MIGSKINVNSCARYSFAGGSWARFETPQSLVGAKEVKLLGKEKYFIDTYASHARASNRAADNHALITQLPRYFNELVAVVGMLIATPVLLSRNGDEVVLTLAMCGIVDRLIDDLTIRRAIEAARLGKFVDSPGAGLDTEVGDCGVRLSGGQRQRIGIARARYHDPKMLVLGEGASALDTVTELQIVNVLTSLGKDKTVIVMAYRLSTVRECDTIYLVKGGRAAFTCEGLSAQSRDFQDLLNPAGRPK